MKRRCIPVREALIGWLVVCGGGYAADWYVATNGSDGNTGTLAEPFGTIQRASSSTAPGDTVYIRGGTYRETVTPAHSGAPGQPILYTSYNGESVTVSGLDLVTNTWSLHAGSIYRVDVGNWYFEQLFVDGEEYMIAQWPNSPNRDRLDKTWMGTVGLASTQSWGDVWFQDLNIPGDYWTGASIWIVSGAGEFTSFTYPVKNYDPATHTVTFYHSYVYSATYRPTAGNRYYLKNKLEALDVGGEWYLDPTNHMLYVMTLATNSPALHRVEAKKRDVTLNLAGKSHIQWDGIDFLGGRVLMTDPCSWCNVRNGSIKYAMHREDAGWWAWKFPEGISGVDMRGNNNRLEQMEVAYACMSGVTLLGISNEVVRCTLHDLDYSGGALYGAITYGGNTYTQSSLTNRFLAISQNTIYRVGRDGIGGQLTDGIRITNNDIYHYGMLCKDLGGIYVYYEGAMQGTASEIARNVIHDTAASAADAVGIYFDDNLSKNYVVHHNVLYNSGIDGLFINDVENETGRNLKVYNNTFYNHTYSVLARGNVANGNAFRNNLGTDRWRIDTVGIPVSNNFTNGNPLWVSAAARDFRLQSGSPCRDAGIEVAPYTDGYVGAAPDQGAFEYGAAGWAAGSGAGAGAPQAPTSLVAIPSAGVSLAWRDLSNDEVEFRVERKVDEGAFAPLGAVGANQTNYVDVAGLTAGTRYTYRVYAVNALFNSRFSNEASVMGEPDDEAPSTPSNLVLTARTPTGISLAWNAATDNVAVAGYRVYRDGAAAGTSATTNYADEGLTPDTAWSYQVSAYDAAMNESALSAVLAVTTLPPDTQAPSVPDNVRATVVTENSISLAWAPSTDNVGVAQYRILESDSPVGISAQTNFTHGGLTPSTLYSYTVQAGDAAGNWSAASHPPVNATTPALGLTNGLLGYWNLDEGSGTTAYDSSGNGYNGALAGAAAPARVFGKQGAGAVYFNITSFPDPSRCEIASTTLRDTLAGGAKGYSISAWAKPRATPAPNYCGHVLIAGQCMNNDLDGNFLGFSSAGKFDMNHCYNDGTRRNARASAAASVPLNEWCHVAGVVDRTASPAQVRIYTNGVLSATAAWSSSSADAGPRGYLWKFAAWGGGRDYGAQQQIEIDDVRMYNRPLSDAEVLALAGVAPPDTRAPTLTVLTPANLSYTTNSQVNVTGTAADALSVASVTVNGAAASTSNGFTNWNRTVTGLAVGTNLLTVVATDAAANAATSLVRVIYAVGAFDGNADGLPDVWQIVNFGLGFRTNALAGPDADADGDGMSNREEQLAGTNPNDGGDCLEASDAETLPGGGFTVQWKSVSGHVYVVQGSTNLAGWVDLNPSVTATSSRSEMTDSQAIGTAQRFYRVEHP